mgnify:CR=1 FL=1
MDVRKLQKLAVEALEDIKGRDADWRRFIQGALYMALVSDCGARFFTPFFIRGEGSGHGEYWLVHLSQHHRAQDVMKEPRKCPGLERENRIAYRTTAGRLCSIHSGRGAHRGRFRAAPPSGRTV